MKSAIAIAVTMAVLFVGAAGQAETQDNTTTTEATCTTSDLSHEEQVSDSIACEAVYTLCLNEGGSETKCLIDAWACVVAQQESKDEVEAGGITFNLGDQRPNRRCSDSWNTQKTRN